MALAYSYVRFSSPEQLKGDSLRRQLELSQRYVEAHGLTLDTSLSLHDLGLSAFHGTNVRKGALGAFLAAIENGKVKAGSYLLVESLDRLSRAQVIDALELFTSIINKGIVIVTLSDGQVYSRTVIENNWTNLIISIAIMARAHEESATKSRRLFAAWGKKVSDARSGGKKVSSTCPYWLELSRDRTYFIQIPERVAIVKMIYAMAIKGMGTGLIERELNQQDIPSMGLSKNWHRSYIQNILTSRAVIGEYQYRSGKGGERKASGDPISGYYPAIISEAEFYAVQNLMKAKRTKAPGRKGIKIPNLLTGLCKCGYCGATMNYVDKGKSESQRFLVCSTAKRGLGCRHIPWVYGEIENIVLNFVTELEIKEFPDEDFNALERELTIVEGRIGELLKAQSNLLKAIEQATEVQVLVTRLVDVEKELIDLKKQEEVLKISVNDKDTLEHRVERLAQLRTSLKTLQGTELYEKRLRINSELKAIIDRVQFFPLGLTEQPQHDHAVNLNHVKSVIQPHSGKDFRFLCVQFSGGQERYVFPKAADQRSE